MRRLSWPVRAVCAAALVLGGGASGARADTIVYSPANQSVLSNTLTSLGADGSTSASSLESYIVPGAGGTSTRLDFGFVQDLGGYQFTFGFYDAAAVTANPAADRRSWALQALSSGTVVFDNREISAGATASFDVAAGSEIGLFLIPNDTLAAVLDTPDAFFGGSRPDPLFSVSNANPGAFDQLLAFDTGSFLVFAFEDLTRTGWSDMDYNDLVVTMTATPSTQGYVAQIDTIAEPRPVWLLAAALLPLAFARRRRHS